MFFGFVIFEGNECVLCWGSKKDQNQMNVPDQWWTVFTLFCDNCWVNLIYSSGWRNFFNVEINGFKVFLMCFVKILERILIYCENVVSLKNNLGFCVWIVLRNILKTITSYYLCYNSTNNWCYYNSTWNFSV